MEEKYDEIFNPNDCSGNLSKDIQESSENLYESTETIEDNKELICHDNQINNSISICNSGNMDVDVNNDQAAAKDDSDNSRCNGVETVQDLESGAIPISNRLTYDHGDMEVDVNNDQAAGKDDSDNSRCNEVETVRDLESISPRRSRRVTSKKVNYSLRSSSPSDISSSESRDNYEPYKKKRKIRWLRTK